MPRRWPQEKKDEAIALYKQGMKYETITAKTGVPMATIVYWLHERGIKPNRRNPVNANGDVTVDALLTRLADTERRNGELEAENRILRAKVFEQTEAVAADRSSNRSA